jgi:putative hydrolase of the HAD superfamily
MMKTKKLIPVTTLFLDIGGVMLSNGWGHESRRSAAHVFNLDFDDMDERHHVIQVTYEEGKITLNEYLKRVVFYQKRFFTIDQFREYMFSQSTPNIEMIDYIRQLKDKYNLKIAIVNNEGRELNEHRIKKFKLNQFVDFFISSCFVHFRKPDADIFRIALDIAQIPAERVVYIENTEMFVDVASDLGIRSILHKDYLSTSAELSLMGLKVE